MARGRGIAVWGLALAAFVVLWLAGARALPWAFEVPKGWIIPAGRWITAFTKWLLNDATFGLFTFAQFTRFIAAVIDLPYRFVLSILSTGFLDGQGSAAKVILPPLPWLGVALVFALFGLWAGGAGLAALVFACFGFLLVFGQWQSAMVTLASILVAVPLGVAGGLMLGVLGWRHP